MPIDFTGGGPLDGQTLVGNDEMRAAGTDPSQYGGPDPFGGGAPDQGAPPDQAPTDDPVSVLNRMIADAKTYLEVEQDEEDKATMTKVLSQLQSYLAKEQKEAHAALGISPAQKFVAKQTAGLR